MALNDLKKNKGPALISYNVGGNVTIGGEWIAKVGTVQVEQKVPLSFTLATNGTPPPGPGSPIIRPTPILLDETLVQTLTDERKYTSITLPAQTDISGGSPPGGGPAGSWTLVSEERIPNGQVATRTKSIVPEGSHLLLDDTMLTAEQRNIGVALEQVVLQAPLPGPGIVDAQFSSSNIITVTKTRKQAATIALGEKITVRPGGGGIGGGAAPPAQLIWQKITKEGETATVATEVNTSELLPGASVLSYRLDPDATLVTITRTLKDISKINRGETLNVAHSLWTKTSVEEVSALVATEVVEARTLPTVAAISTRAEPDGTTSVSYKRKRAAADIVTAEHFEDVYDNAHPPHHLGYNWVKVYREGETGLVATEVTEVRFISDGAQANVVSTTTIGSDGLKVDADVKLKRTQDALLDVAITDPANLVGFIASHDFKEVGGLVSEETFTTKEWLNKQTFTISQELPLPAEYRGLAVITQKDNIVRGDDPFPYGGPNNRAKLPTLASGEIEHTEQQLDNLLKKTSVKSVSLGTTSQTTEELTEEYGGLVLDVTRTLKVLGDDALDIPDTEATDSSVISDKVTPYGAFGIRERRTKKTAEGYHVLQGTEIDTELNFAVGFVQQVQNAGVTGSVALGTSTEVRPLDAARSLVIQKTVDTGAINSFMMEYPGTTNVDIPPQLIAINVQTKNVSGSAGYHDETGGFNILNAGSGSMTLNAEGFASAAAVMDIVPVIKQVHGSNVKCDNYLFFFGGDPYPLVTYTDVLHKLNTQMGSNFRAWPQFKPEPVQIICYGENRSIKATQSMYRMSGFIADYLGDVQASQSAGSDGSGVSYTSELTAKTVSIPPTIHQTITFSSTMTPVSSSARGKITMNNVVYTPGTVSAISQGSLSTGTVTGTDGQQTIPSGTQGYVHHMRLEPYKYGYFKCFVEVVYANDW